jgi:DNA-binding response OmpR family regulator
MKVLLIEDNPRLSERIRSHLSKWYIVEAAMTGHEGIELVSSHQFDIVLLDLGLPDITGKEVCDTIRSLSPGIPILVVSGIDTTESRVSLLDSGADDYVAKPFEPVELRARINALVRRLERSESIESIQVGPLIIWPANRKVERSGVAVSLRRKEFDILEYLARNKGRILSRQMIVNHAWPSTSKSWPGSVDVHIKQLRDKIDRPFDTPLIKTSYGVGYMIESEKAQ